MKITLATFIILSSLISEAQIPADSLEKYSYPIIGVNSYVFVGTCFFIKNDNKLFLITAKHIILGCDSANKKIEPYPNNFIIGCAAKPENSINIDVKAYQKSHECDGLDIYVYPVDDKYYNLYNSVEKFLIPSLDKWKTIEVFAYPKSTYNTKSEDLIIPDKAEHENIPEQSFDFEPDRDKDDKIDTLHGKITIPSKVNIRHGYSGAPLFLQDKISGTWRLFGVMVAGENPKRDSRSAIFYVDIKYVMAEIERLH